MLINADFQRPVIVLPEEQHWVASPQPGVERVMLDRVGGEQARATSLVRYAPGSDFPVHAHPGGEEILVLSGTFSDEVQDCPAGWYLRNPPGSAHRPSSREGTLLFVKLRQMSPDDLIHVRIDTHAPANWTRDGERQICPLHRHAIEQVCLLRLPADLPVCTAVVEGAELLVLDGSVTVGDRLCPAGSWIRLPAGSHPAVAAGASGTTIYLKTGVLGRFCDGLVPAVIPAKAGIPFDPVLARDVGG